MLKVSIFVIDAKNKTWHNFFTFFNKKKIVEFFGWLNTTRIASYGVQQKQQILLESLHVYKDINYNIQPSLPKYRKINKNKKKYFLVYSKKYLFFINKWRVSLFFIVIIVYLCELGYEKQKQSQIEWTWYIF